MPSPLVRQHKYGLLHFQILVKRGNMPLPLNVQKLKVFQCRGGGLGPSDQTRSSALDPIGGSAPGPAHHLVLFAGSPCAPVPYPKYANSSEAEWWNWVFRK